MLAIPEGPSCTPGKRPSRVSTVRTGWLRCPRSSSSAITGHLLLPLHSRIIVSANAAAIAIALFSLLLPPLGANFSRFIHRSSSACGRQRNDSVKISDSTCSLLHSGVAYGQRAAKRQPGCGLIGEVMISPFSKMRFAQSAYIRHRNRRQQCFCIWMIPGRKPSSFDGAFFSTPAPDT